jgi:hypothetical protein
MKIIFVFDKKVKIEIKQTIVISSLDSLNLQKIRCNVRPKPEGKRRIIHNF